MGSSMISRAKAAPRAVTKPLSKVARPRGVPYPVAGPPDVDRESDGRVEELDLSESPGGLADPTVPTLQLDEMVTSEGIGLTIDEACQTSDAIVVALDVPFCVGCDDDCERDHRPLWKVVSEVGTSLRRNGFAISDSDFQHSSLDLDSELEVAIDPSGGWHEVTRVRMLARRSDGFS